MMILPDASLLPAGRDLLLERPCKVKRFLALAAEWPDWPAEASAERESKMEQGLVSSAVGKKKRSRPRLFESVEYKMLQMMSE